MIIILYMILIIFLLPDSFAAEQDQRPAPSEPVTDQHKHFQTLRSHDAICTWSLSRLLHSILMRPCGKNASRWRPSIEHHLQLHGHHRLPELFSESIRVLLPFKGH